VRLVIVENLRALWNRKNMALSVIFLSLLRYRLAHGISDQVKLSLHGTIDCAFDDLASRF